MVNQVIFLSRGIKSFKNDMFRILYGCHSGLSGMILGKPE